MKKKILIGLSIVSILTPICVISGLNINGTKALANQPSCQHDGFHYSLVAPTIDKEGHKEFWTCCKCSTQFLELPQGHFVDHTDSEMIGAIDTTHIAYLPKLGSPVKVYGTKDFKDVIDLGFDELVLAENLSLNDDSVLVVPVGKNITFNLDGNVISKNSTATKDDPIIDNHGTLTICSNEPDAKLTALFENPSTSNSYCSNTICNRGTLNINDDVTIENLTSASCAYAIDNNSTIRDAILNIGGGKFFAPNNNSCIRLFANSSTNENIANISGGYFEANYYTIRGHLGSSQSNFEINITDGEFESLADDYNYNVSCNLATFENGTIGIDGGIFHDVFNNIGKCVRGGTYDIKISDEFIADGYIIKENLDGTYTVMKSYTVEKKVEESIPDQISSILAERTHNEPVLINVPKDDNPIVLPNSMVNVTIKGDGTTIIDASNIRSGYTNLNLEDAIVQGGTSAGYYGYQHSSSISYNNCKITGFQKLYADEVVFNDCVFTQDSYEYCFWTYGAKNVIFNNCVFNTLGKAAKIYNEDANSSNVYNVSFVDCEFNSTGVGKNKPAIAINTLGCTFEVNICNCSANNFSCSDDAMTDWYTNRMADATEAEKCLVGAEGLIDNIFVTINSKEY